MITNQKIIINSLLNSKLSKSWSFKIVSKIQIASLIDDRITVSFKNYESKKNKIPFVAQRDASWIRINFKDKTFRDFISEEILVLSSKSGILINLLGDCYEFSDKSLIEKILKYLQNHKIKKINFDFQFLYKKQMGKKIMTNINELMKKKNDISINKLSYFAQRRKVLKEAIELMAEKRCMERQWDEIYYKIIKLRGSYEN